MLTLVRIQPFSNFGKKFNKILKKIFLFINLKITSKKYLNNKKLFNFFNLKKKYRNKIKNYLIQKFEPDNQIFIKKKYIYYPIFWKSNFILYHSISYNSYQNKFKLFKYRYCNIKYFKIINVIQEKIYKMKVKNLYFHSTFFKRRLRLITKFLLVYNVFFCSIYIDLFHFTKYIKKKKLLFYYLILSFKKNKLFMNLKNFSKKNFFFLSTGFFIKFFEKKKSFKKNKTIKLLMAKFLRKITLILKIKNIVLIVKRNPVFLNELITFFNSPVAHKFLNPLENKIIDESDTNFIWLKFLYFIFIENKNFSKNKVSQKGRIKSKVLRKIFFENKIID